MLEVTGALSVLSVTLRAGAFDAWRVHLLAWGSEGTLYVVGSSSVLGARAAIAALAIVALRARTGHRQGLGPIAPSAAASLVVPGLLAAAGVG